MTEARRILEMIESVDPQDTETLDEIDLLVWNLVFDFEDDLSQKPTYINVHDGKTTRCIGPHTQIWTAFTQSRDALKAIRPEGWRHTFNGLVYWAIEPKGIQCELVNEGMDAFLKSTVLPTEELAELHAIVQTIEHERKE